LARSKCLTAALVVLTLLAAVFLGRQPRLLYIALPIGGVAALVLLSRPVIGLGFLIVFALVLPTEFGTGSDVTLNIATLLIPCVALLWLLDMLRRRDVEVVPSQANRPLLLFLVAGLVSLLVGNALWDSSVPRPTNLALVQLAQWGIFAFSALAFWLTANLVATETTLHRLTWIFLGVGGSLAILKALPGTGALVSGLATAAVTRAPFWMLLVALGGGQLLFDSDMSLFRKGYLTLALCAAMYCVYVVDRSTVSGWVGVTTAAAVLLWLRYPRAHGALVAALLVASPFLLPRVFAFGGGESEWVESGGSRLVLIERVVEVTLRNPVTGLGPASYRAYASVEPLSYQGAYWVQPSVNSHNNYVDLFAHTGLLGLGLFMWFVWELGRIGLRQTRQVCPGARAGYVAGALGALAGSLVLMMLADWILPFVYNIGFPGYQASVLVWLFLGGLVAGERWRPTPEAS